MSTNDIVAKMERVFAACKKALDYFEACVADCNGDDVPEAEALKAALSDAPAIMAEVEAMENEHGSSTEVRPCMYCNSVSAAHARACWNCGRFFTTKKSSPSPSPSPPQIGVTVDASPSPAPTSQTERKVVKAWKSMTDSDVFWKEDAGFLVWNVYYKKWFTSGYKNESELFQHETAEEIPVASLPDAGQSEGQPVLCELAVNREGELVDPAAIPAKAEARKLIPSNDVMGGRCGHNYTPAECLYTPCGYRDSLAELAAKDAEIERLREANSGEYQRGRSDEQAARATVENSHIASLNSQLATVTKDRDEWKHEWEMYSRAWLRELGGKTWPKTHPIDELVCTTRRIYTEWTQQSAQLATARRDAFEEAAKVCDEEAFFILARKIRALAAGEAKGATV